MIDLSDLRPPIDVEALAGLTSEQEELVISVPGVAERAAYDVTRSYGPILPPNDMVQEGHVGVIMAAITFEEGRSAFKHWARFCAAMSILDAARKELRHRSLYAACRAAMLYLGREYRILNLSDEADDMAEGLCVDFEDDIFAAMLEAARPREAQGEEAIAEHETWGSTLDALRTVIAGLAPHQRHLLSQIYEKGYDLKRLSKMLDIKYWTLLDRYHELIKLVRARLRGLGITEITKPPEEEQPHPSVFSRSPATGKGRKKS